MSVGLKGYEKSPSSIAVCFVCGAKIKKGVWRCDYRLKASNTLKDQRRCHAECAAGLPLPSRAFDLQVAAAWRETAVLGNDAQETVEMLDGLLEALGGGPPGGGV